MRAHAGRRTPLRVVSVLLITRNLFGYSISFGDLWGGFWSFLTGIGNDVKNFVLEAVQKAADALLKIINAVDDTYHAVTGVLTEGLAAAGRLAVNAAAAVTNVVEQTVAEVGGAFSNFRDEVKSVIEHAWGDVKNWILDPAGDFLKGVFGDGWEIIKKLVDLGVAGLDFLISLALDPFGTIWGIIEQAVKDTLSVALPAFDWIVQQGLDILFAGFGDVVKVIKDVWHILVWLGEHAADLTEDALTASFSLGATVFDDQVVNSLTAHSDDLERIVADWFA